MTKAETTRPELMVASGDGEPVKPEKDRKFVEALSRGLDVLRAFSQGSVILGNQDISRLTGLPKPTVSRMTYTLTKLGYLSYNAQEVPTQLRRAGPGLCLRIQSQGAAVGQTLHGRVCAPDQHVRGPDLP